MTIFDNIENFDIAYADVDLPEDEEIRLLEHLREVVEALVPLRGSKMKTRHYFKKHLHLTPGDNTPRSRIDTHGDLFLGALYSILIDERYSFGFIMNLLTAELRVRGITQDLCPAISDAAVRYALNFDMDDIRQRLGRFADPGDRLIFLYDKQSESRSYDISLFYDEEYDDLVQFVEAQLTDLFADTQQLIDLLDKRQRRGPEPLLENPKILKSAAKNDAGTSSAKPSKPAPKRPVSETALEFTDAVTPRKRKKLLKLLHEHVGYKPGVQELEYICALYDLKLLRIPGFQAMCQEFPAYLGKNSTFSGLLGSSGILLTANRSDKHKAEIRQLVSELSRALK